jgi:putative intracellular protease/amidase
MSTKLINPVPSFVGRTARALLRSIGVHPEDNAAGSIDLTGRSALCIATNHAVLDLGVPTGVFASELTVPFYLFQDAGMCVDLGSPRGGVVPVEPLSLKQPIRTAADDRLLADDEFRRQLAESLPIGEIDFTRYDLIYFAGGWGAAFDLAQSETLGVRVSEAHAAGRVLGGICHGPLGLLKARRADGELLVKDRRITAVTDQQVRQLGVSITPLHPESALRAAGARYECRHHALRDFFANHWVADDELITGQNQNSGPMVARLMLQRVAAGLAPSGVDPRFAAGIGASTR